MVISSLKNAVDHSLSAVTTQISDAVFGAPIRLGVTGLARSGKTVFLTSLIANLLQGGRMKQMSVFAQGRVQAVYLQPNPDDTAPRFPFEKNLAAILENPPRWPDNTTGISQIRLSLRMRPDGILSGLRPDYVQHIDLVDYPGEWILDLTLLDKDFDQWSQSILARIRTRAAAKDYLTLVDQLDPKADFSEEMAQKLSDAYTRYLQRAQREGFSDLVPGRFLLPGNLAGSPVLTFAPVWWSDSTMHGPLAKEMARRFRAYQKNVVKPFFRNNFAQIDRQVILFDLLGALENGPKSTQIAQDVLIDLMAAFRTGQNSRLGRLFSGTRVDKILLIGTKADHLAQTQHSKMTEIIQSMLDQALRKAQFSGVTTGAMAVASIRCTTETEKIHDGKPKQMVQGTLAETGQFSAVYPGTLPENPGRLLADMSNATEDWQFSDYEAYLFLPPENALRPGQGIAHIRMDQAAEFLLGDRL